MITIVNLAIATLAWIYALYFFRIEIKQWEVSYYILYFSIYVFPITSFYIYVVFYFKEIPG